MNLTTNTSVGVVAITLDCDEATRGIELNVTDEFAGVTVVYWDKDLWQWLLLPPDDGLPF
jgi:hypothetical protein